MRTALSHISCFLYLSWTHVKERGIASYKDFIYALGPRQGLNFMDRKNDTMYRSLQGGHLGHFKVVIFIDVKNNEKLQFNY